MPKPTFNEDYESLVDIIVETRRRAGVSQRWLAARLGKSQSHIYMLEQRQRRIELREFYLICKCLEVDPVEIFSRMTEALELKRAA